MTFYNATKLITITGTATLFTQEILIIRKKIHTFGVMEFFTSTGFYCLAVVLAIALLGVLLHSSQQKPVESYIVAATLHPVLQTERGLGYLRLCVKPDGTVALERTGIIAHADAAVNLTAEVKGDKVKIVEKLASQYISTSPESAMIATADLKFFTRGRWAVRYESEVTGTWCTLSMPYIEGYSAKAEMRY